MKTFKKFFPVLNILLIAILVLTCGTNPDRQNKNSGESLLMDDLDYDSLNDYFNDLASKDLFSGVVLIGRNNNVLFHRAYGYADREKQIPMQGDTKLNLGSNNKSFTAIAICQLQQQGKLAFSDNLEKYLPEFANISKGSITIEQLLTHTSGFGNFMTSPGYQANLDRMLSSSDVIPFILEQPLLFAPGSSYAYSNSGYMILGAVIEKVSGKDYFTYINEHIYKPAGMTGSGSFGKFEIIENLANGYTLRNGAAQINTGTLSGRGSSSGGGYSTAPDMFAYINALNNDLLIKDTFDTILPGRGKNYGYGIGENPDGSFGHSGGAEGISAYYGIFLDTGYSVVLMANVDGDSRTSRDILPAISSFLGIEPAQRTPPSGQGPGQGPGNQTEEIIIKLNDVDLVTRTKPQMMERVVHVPLGEVCEALGIHLEITGNGAVITKDSIIISLKPGTQVISVNGAEKTLTDMIREADGILMVSPRFFTEALGYRSGFMNGTVRISNP